MATEPPATTEEPLEQPHLTYKTWVLKVSIHCEGCKRKVKKVLHSVEGVYNTNIDTKQQKVIVTGNVEAQTLIRKLEKSGKHAELWPETAGQQKAKKSKKSKKKEKQIDPESGTEEDTPQETEKQPVKVEVIHEPAKISDGGFNPTRHGGGGGGACPVKIGGGGVRFIEVDAKTATTGGAQVLGAGGTVKFSEGVVKISGGGGGGGGGGQVAQESKSEGKKPETGTSGHHSPAAEKKSTESDDGAGKSGSGGGNGKKKKRKGKKVGFEGEPSSGGGGAPASTGSPNHYSGPPPENLSPPRHHGHQYPPHYYNPQPLVYAVSYNTAYPTSSHTTTSYYASPPPQSYGYTYSGGVETEPPLPPPDLEPYPRQPLDSFELFSDENPNGCSIM